MDGLSCRVRSESCHAHLPVKHQKKRQMGNWGSYAMLCPHLDEFSTYLCVMYIYVSLGGPSLYQRHPSGHTVERTACQRWICLNFGPPHHRNHWETAEVWRGFSSVHLTYLTCFMVYSSKAPPETTCLLPI